MTYAGFGSTVHSLLAVASVALVAVASSTFAAPPAPSEPTEVVTDLPRVTGVKVDGAVSDWQGQGLVIHALAGEKPLLRKGADFDVLGRLGWNDEGVLLQVEVTDSTPFEQVNPDIMYEGDCVEFFIMPNDQAQGFPQLVATPGRTKDVTETRLKVFDYRSLQLKKEVPAFTPRVACKTTERGYVMDLLFPWSSIKVKPEIGAIVGVRFAVNDSDATAAQRAGWLNYKKDGNWWNNLPRVRLAEKPSVPNPIAVWGGVDDLQSIYINAVAEPGHAGKTLSVVNGLKVVSAPLALDGTRATARILLPVPPPPDGVIPSSLTAFLDGQPLQSVTLPDLPKQYREMFLSGQGRGRPDDANAWLKPSGPAVFSGAEFPKIDYPEPERIRKVYGDYALNTAYYDAAFARVTRPTGPGRYGAITTAYNPAGDIFTRYQTLYRTAPDVTPTTQSAATQITLAQTPAAKGFDIAKADRDWWHALRKKIGTAVRYEYFVRLPKAYDADPRKRWPVIFFLHGSGGGNDPKWTRIGGPQGYALNNPDFPFITVSLRSPDGAHNPGGWLVPAVEDVIDQVATTTRTDPARYYLCGFSMGAIATWDITEDRPERFAAVAAVGGRHGDLQRVAAIKYPPAWIINGDADIATTSADALQMVNALKAAGAEVKWTEIPGATHGDSGGVAFNWDELYTWFLQHHR